MIAIQLVAVAGALLLLPPGVEAQKKKEVVSEGTRLSQRIKRIHSRLAEVTVDDPAAKTLARTAESYLDRAGQAVAEEKYGTADGLASAGEALTRAVDHIRHYHDVRKVDFPPREEQARHLERAYLRLRQADYFQAQSKDPQGKSLLGTARQFYHRARSAYDRREARGADEYTKVSEEIVNALEHLAHTALPVPVPPRLR